MNAWGSACAMLLDMLRQRAQAGENLPVVRIVRPQLKAVMLGHGQRNLQGIDGIQPQVATKQGRVRLDLLGRDRFQIQTLHNQRGQFVLRCCLLGHARFQTHDALPTPRWQWSLSVT